MNQQQPPSDLDFFELDVLADNYLDYDVFYLLINIIVLPCSLFILILLCITRCHICCFWWL